MKIVRTVAEMQELSRTWCRAGHRVALVPTMGFLHEGHLSLIRIAAQQAEKVVVSIFVNPTQFGPGEDFETYPRDFEADENACRQNNVAAVFYPSADELYPRDFSTWITEECLSLPLCGQMRAGHFRGVTTIVAKLFNAVLPDLAVFGRKDAQQALVIQRMTGDLNFPVEIVLGPIVREPDGLAMSSRNVYLSSDERKRALAINRGLAQVEEAYRRGEKDAEKLRQIVRGELENAAPNRIDYIELVSQADLQPIRRVEQPSLLAVAVFFGKTRLIDNRFL